MKSIFIALLIIASTQLYAQRSSTFPCVMMELTTEPTGVVDSIGITDSTLYQTQMLVNLYDTLAVYRFTTKIGRSDGAGDIVTHTFDFDATPSGGFTYSRNGYDVTLGFPNLPDMRSFYSELVIERTDHTYTESIVFSRLKP